MLEEVTQVSFRFVELKTCDAFSLPCLIVSRATAQIITGVWDGLVFELVVLSMIVRSG